MQLKTLVELLSLSSNMYMLSKDEELIQTLEKYANKSKVSLESLLHGFSNDEYAENYNIDGDHQLVSKLIEKAKFAKEELDKKIEEIALNVYNKLQIAHKGEVDELKNQLSVLKRELTITKERLAKIEDK